MSTTMSLFLFRCGGRFLAIDVRMIADLAELDGIVNLPLGPPEVLGLRGIRREIVPVVRPRCPTGGDSRNVDGHQIALMLRTEHGAWSLCIDRRGATTAIVHPPFCHHQPSPDDDFLAITGVYEGASQRYGVIDPEETWDNLRLRVDRWYQSLGRSHEVVVPASGLVGSESLLECPVPSVAREES